MSNGTSTSSAHLANADVNFLDLDLNLLIALDALLGEQSVTGAAEVLQRSQPAVSASLKRLRYEFQDDLLVRVGNHYELTPLARQLRQRVAMVMADVERLFATRRQVRCGGVDPAVRDPRGRLRPAAAGPCERHRARRASAEHPVAPPAALGRTHHRGR